MSTPALRKFVANECRHQVPDGRASQLSTQKNVVNLFLSIENYVKSPIPAPLFSETTLIHCRGAPIIAFYLYCCYRQRTEQAKYIDSHSG